MRSVIQKYAATLLLAMVSAFLGNTLAESVACAGQVAGSQMVVVTNDGDHDYSDCNCHHCMSCETWLCNGFSGVIIATEAAMTFNVNTESVPFALFVNDIFPSRTVEPLLGPPRAYQTALS